jgi:hypothetical protein
MRKVSLPKGFTIPQDASAGILKAPEVAIAVFRRSEMAMWHGTDDHRPEWDRFGNSPERIGVGYAVFLGVFGDVADGSDLYENENEWFLSNRPLAVEVRERISRARDSATTELTELQLRSAVLGLSRLLEMLDWEDGTPEFTLLEVHVLDDARCAVGEAIASALGPEEPRGWFDKMRGL